MHSLYTLYTCRILFYDLFFYSLIIFWFFFFCDLYNIFIAICCCMCFRCLVSLGDTLAFIVGNTHSENYLPHSAGSSWVFGGPVTIAPTIYEACVSDLVTGLAVSRYGGWLVIYAGSTARTSETRLNLKYEKCFGFYQPQSSAIGHSKAGRARFQLMNTL